jgi:hypothetical protein
MKSIIQSKKECFECMSYSNLEEHHIFFGTANRKLSEKDGLKVWLCPYHHRGTKGVHGKDGHTLDSYLKSIAQLAYMQYYNKTKEEFIKRYGKNYL